MEYNFETIRDNGLLLYEYIRGSQAYGLALPTSDEDHGGVFIMKTDDYLGLPEYKHNQVEDERNDVVWYEIGKFVDLLCNANPNMLEALFVPERCVLYMHPLFKVIYEHRDMFITQKCFKSFVGYANEQIEKARGLKKKIVRPVTERKRVIDFCYCPDDRQGSMPIEKWLAEKGLMQRYCGLNHIPNMEMNFGVYYDYGTHLRCEYTHDTFNQAFTGDNLGLWRFIDTMIEHGVIDEYFLSELRFGGDMRYEKLIDVVQPKGYHGIMRDDGLSDEVRLDSLQKGDIPLKIMRYNKNGYTCHCDDYRDYQEWVKRRNPQRFLENKGKEFDRKNMCHCMRLLTMGIEIAKTGKVNVDRTDIDRDVLLGIRLGDATYEELIARAEEKKSEMKSIIGLYKLANTSDDAYAKMTDEEKALVDDARLQCPLPQSVDRDKLNTLLIDFRKRFYGDKL